jgi:ribose 5-phosphate isomerase
MLPRGIEYRKLEENENLTNLNVVLVSCGLGSKAVGKCVADNGNVLTLDVQRSRTREQKKGIIIKRKRHQILGVITNGL